MNYIKTIPVAELPESSHKVAMAGKKRIALFHYAGKITALGNTCLHKGGSLGDGYIQVIEGELYVACPWHGWQYNLQTGKGPHGYLDCQSTYETKVEDGYIWVSEEATKKPFLADHDLSGVQDLISLKYQTTPTSLNIMGISCTNNNPDLPRVSTSENALEIALDHAKTNYKAQTKILKLRELDFKACEGYYSRHEKACSWPCTISEFNPHDGMTQVYRDMVLWADVVLLSTPIRWGNPSALFFKMAERLNTVQNQITTKKKVLIQNKVAAFIVTGGQDNIQQVVGQLSVFFTQLGFILPPFNFMGWSRGWVAEDMENNVKEFQKSQYVIRAAKDLVNNTIQLCENIKNVNFSKLKSPSPQIDDLEAV